MSLTCRTGSPTTGSTSCRIWHINNFSVAPVTDPPGREPDSSRPGARTKTFMFLGFRTQHINFLTPGHRSGDPRGPPPSRETPPPPGQSPEKFVYVYVPFSFLCLSGCCTVVGNMPVTTNNHQDLVKSTAVHMGGILQYKWETNCDTNGRTDSISSSLAARGTKGTAIQLGGVLQYKWEVYCDTFAKSTPPPKLLQREFADNYFV